MAEICAQVQLHLNCQNLPHESHGVLQYTGNEDAPQTPYTLFSIIKLYALPNFTDEDGRGHSQVSTMKR